MAKTGRPRNDEKWVKLSLQLKEKTLIKFSQFCEKNCITRAKLLEEIVTKFMEKNQDRNLNFE